ncbi:uncharacterized protein LOC142234740 [Haematobia irritans]|uniref:uncharacterized protein LOC142234740 n=1 Tax=Haematobia irritans TaxID=7368 RepID=UPI003F506D30
MQKQEKRRELRLKRFWRSPKTTSSEESTGYESPTRAKNSNDVQRFNHLHYTSLAQSAPSHDGGADSEGGGRANTANKNKSCLSGGGSSFNNKPTCSLPLLQVWPSQDSPRGEADGQSFIFPVIAETSTSSSSGGGNSTSTSGGGNTLLTNTSGNSSNSASNRLTLNTEDRRNSLYCDTLHAGDSGIDSVQASPSPNALPASPGSTLIGLANVSAEVGSCNASPATTPTQGSPNPSLRGGNRMGARASISVGAPNYRRKSSALLHPDHARLFALRMKHAAALERAQTSPDQTSIEDATEFHDNGLATNLRLCSASSSTTSSLTSVAAVSLGGGVSSSATAAAALAAAAGAGAQQRVSDPWLQPQSDRERDSRHDRRRSSTVTRYSLFDALDLEYALLRAAARGSVGPYSLSESIHKLTFTQSLAFPALARGLASKRRRSATRMSSRPLNPNESGLNTCAKVVTAIILVAISFMVFLIVYKFVRT